MHVFDLFTAAGAYEMRDGKPLYADLHFVLPPVTTRITSAAVLEIAGRLVFESLFVPVDPACAWLEAPMQGLSHASCRVVIGEHSDWVSAQLADPVRVDAYLQEQNQMSAGQGLLGVWRDADGSTMFLVTGFDGPGLLEAARVLAASRLDLLDADSGSRLVEQRSADGVASYEDDKAAGYLFRTSGVPPDGLVKAPAEGKKMYGWAPGSLHDLTALPGLYENSQDGERLLVGQVRVAVEGLAHLYDSVRLLAALCQCSTGIRYPLTHVHEVDGQRDRFQVDVGPGLDAQERLHMQLGEHALTVRLATDFAPDVREALTAMFAPLPMRATIPWRDRFQDLTGVARDKAQRTWLNYRLSGDTARPAQLEPAREAPSLAWQWQEPGERAELLRLLAHEVTAHVKRHRAAVCEGTCDVHDVLRVEIFTSLSTGTADELRRTAQDVVDACGHVAQVSLRFAHKAGLHWFIQEVLPQLRGRTDLAGVRLSARRFTGETHPLGADTAPAGSFVEDVDRAQKIGAHGQIAVSDTVDRPIRYLQELYPADAVIVRDLGLEEECIEIALRDSGSMFQVEAQRQDGSLIDTWQFEGWHALRPYLPTLAGTKKVCVPQAGIRVSCGGAVLALYPVMTDAERMWHWYSDTVLPALRRELTTGEDGHKFERLEIHTWLDCEDMAIMDHERSSVGEALAEDLYFDTLDVMRQFGIEGEDPGFARPGAVVPYIHEHLGMGPSAVVSVYPVRGMNDACDLLDWPAPLEHLQVRTVSLCAGKWALGLAGAKWDEVELRHLAHGLTQAGEPAQPSVSTKDLGVDVLYPHDVSCLMHSLPGSVLLDHSYGGLPIWMSECYETLPGYTTSVVKQALWKPTLFINARHHANEVSSTNAALQLMAEFHAGVRVLDRVNVVLIPLQNVDGAKTHEALCAEHPTWMHHAARYNACGEEFARDYFDEASPYGESRTYGRVWARWRPDIVLDDHGIPAHEWVQPFAGFGSPPSFPVSYWIPQARMYTIWRRLADQDEAHQTYQQMLEGHVASYIQADAEVRLANARMLRRYDRWGHRLDPAYFPLTLNEGTLTFAHDVKESPSSSSVIARFPHLVTAEVVTETDDETVTGADLRVRVQAHRVVHRALLDWLTATPQPLMLSHVRHPQGEVTLQLSRPRPLCHTCNR